MVIGKMRFWSVDTEIFVDFAVLSPYDLSLSSKSLDFDVLVLLVEILEALLFLCFLETHISS